MPTSTSSPSALQSGPGQRCPHSGAASTAVESVGGQCGGMGSAWRLAPPLGERLPRLRSPLEADHAPEVSVPLLPASSRAGPAGALCAPRVPSPGRRPSWMLRGVAGVPRAGRPGTPSGTVWEVSPACTGRPGGFCALRLWRRHRTRRGLFGLSHRRAPNSTGTWHGGRAWLAAEPPPAGSPQAWPLS